MSDFNRIAAQALRRLWIKGIAVLILLSCHPALAVSVTEGYTRLGTWSPSLVSTAYGPYNANTAQIYSWGWKLSAWPTTPAEANGAICSAVGLPYTTIDGWSGYQIQPGVLIVLTGNLTATAISAFPDAETDIVTDSYAASWNNKGAMTADGLTPGQTQCAGYKRTFTESFFSLAGGTTTMNVTYGVYVSPTAAEGPLPATYLQLFKTSGHNDRAILSLTNLTVSRTQCSMDTTAVVPFGDVKASVATSGKGVVVQSSLNVNCTNEAGVSEQVTYSVTPKTQAGDQYTLPMISTAGGGIAGDIRGFLGVNAVTDAGCTTTASSVRMDNTRVALRTVVSTQSWSDPLVWVLCPRTMAEPGPATAAVTLDVNW